MAVDLDDTEGCPVGDLCVMCADPDGADSAVTVTTVETPMGVACLTLCRSCIRAGRLPRLSAVGAARLVMEHCGHLGIDVDQMAAAVAEAEQEGRR